MPAGIVYAADASVWNVIFVSLVFLSAFLSCAAVVTVFTPVTLTLHFSEVVLPDAFTFAVMVAVPAATPVTLPFLVTVATFFAFDDQVIVAPFAAFFTDNVVDSPAMTVALVLLSFGFVAADALITGIEVKASARVIMRTKTLFMIVFILFSSFFRGKT
jgi:hypothetical protein